MKVLIVVMSNYDYIALKISDIPIEVTLIVKKIANVLSEHARWFNWNHNVNDAFALYVKTGLITEAEYYEFCKLLPFDEYGIANINSIHLIENMETLL